MALPPVDTPTPAFAKPEFERLRNKVWQATARVDEIPELGDYTVYDIGDQSTGAASKR